MGRATRRRWWLGAVLVVGATTPGAAQPQRFNVPTGAQVKAEYLTEAGKGIKETTDRWKTAVAEEDVEALLKLFTPEGAHFSPAGGASYYGREAIRDGLTERLGQIGAVSLTRVDFSASGTLAYLFGRYFYGPGPEGGAEQGTYVLILYQAGRNWQIRSYVERRTGP